MSGRASRLVVVTGLSGAGKSVVTRCFEDLGYRCVDNLPLAFIEPLFDDATLREGPGWVIVMDVRADGFVELFPTLIARIRAKHPDLRVVFVEATTAALVRRFSETRRPHPFRKVSLEDAVRLERTEMAPIRALADEVLDTSDLSPHELRAEVAARFGTTELTLPMVVRCESFGFRYGVPHDANLVFDVRFLPNPHFVPELRELTGQDPGVRRWLEQQDAVGDAFARFRDLCDALLPAFRQEQKSYVVVAFGCTGGRHRSVYMAERLAEHLTANHWVVAVHHRDRDREG